ncbi:MAG: hypothetical protein EOP33_04005 [Rickettsiaceae bacterium]|nr:MAG: hypothetical protein EOP33_04005 [Rickettsiaceae bacterium]
MSKNRFNKPIIFFVVTFFLLCGTTYKYAVATTIYHDSNEFGSVWVRQNGNERHISFTADNSIAIQSLINLQQPTVIQLEYIKMMLAGILFKPEYEKILVIGLGGGTIPGALNKILPDSKIDVVEINPLIAMIAQNYFSFKPNDNVSIHILDGYKFIEQSKPQLYDLIFLDAFGQDYVPPQFLTTKFISNVKKCLKSNGVAVVNTFVDIKSYELESDLWNEAFDNTVNIDDNYNRIIFAINGAMPSKQQILDNLYKRAFSLYSLGVDANWLTQKFTNSKNIRANIKLDLPTLVPNSSNISN